MERKTEFMFQPRNFLKCGKVKDNGGEESGQGKSKWKVCKAMKERKTDDKCGDRCD